MFCVKAGALEKGFVCGVACDTEEITFLGLDGLSLRSLRIVRGDVVWINVDLELGFGKGVCEALFVCELSL